MARRLRVRLEWVLTSLRLNRALTRYCRLNEAQRMIQRKARAMLCSCTGRRSCLIRRYNCRTSCRSSRTKQTLSLSVSNQPAVLRGSLKFNKLRCLSHWQIKTNKSLDQKRTRLFSSRTTLSQTFHASWLSTV